MANLISGNHNVNVRLNSSADFFGNYVGTDASGMAALIGAPAGAIGIDVRDKAIVGGFHPGEGNLISGNTSDGVSITGNDGRDAFIVGNKIGVDITGLAAIPNAGHGIHSTSTDSGIRSIGSDVAGSGNLISGNTGAGISVEKVGSSTPTDHIIQGNTIGSDITGVAALPNQTAGVDIDDSSDNQVGGSAFMARNLIAFNLGQGIFVHGTNALRNRLQLNKIHSNGGLGIDLGAAGVTANDAGDVDGDANNLQNFPIVTMADSSGFVTATLNSETGKTYSIEFYANVLCDASGNGEGETLLGSKDVTTDSSGNASLSFFASEVMGAENQFVSATATDSAGNTSEFGPCFIIVSPSAFNDADGDGMSDEYELLHFGSTTGGLASVDSDLDGMNNLSEFIAMTIPTNALSLLEVEIEIGPDGVHILIDSESSRFYTLHAADNVPDGFIPISSEAPGDGNMIDFLDLDSTRPRNFYSISVRR